MTTVRVIVTGAVQGVGFRNFVMHNSRQDHVRGWVRNVGRSIVEIVLQGESGAVGHVISQCYMGPDNSIVENVHVETKETSEVYEGFEIKPSIENLPS